MRAPRSLSSVRLALAAAALGALSNAAAANPSDVELHIRIAHPPKGARMVALTLDACSGAFDQRIADELIKDNVPATIFVTHRWLQRNQVAMALLMAHPALFEIEDHGDQHIPAVTDAPLIYGLKTAGSLAAVRQEVDGGSVAIEAITGKRPVWYRDATAVYSRDALREIRAEGYKVAGFTLNADIGATLPAATVEKRIDAAKSGDVIIGHINQPTHSAGTGIAEGVEDLLRTGAVFVRLDQVETQDLNDNPLIAKAQLPKMGVQAAKLPTAQ